MGVKFVTPKDGDSVAVVARSVEKAAEDAVDEAVDADDDGDPVEGGTAPDAPTDGSAEVSADEAPDATIEDGSAPEED